MPTGSPSRREELHREFRPVRTRVVAWGLVAATVVVVGGFLLFAPTSFTPADSVALGLFGVLIVLGLWRQASVHATASEDGLEVRNLVLGRRLAWAEIVAVRLGDRPWVQLDLSDGDTLSVMGIQRSDGERSRREASRLATLVELHSRTSRDG